MFIKEFSANFHCKEKFFTLKDMSQFGCSAHTVLKCFVARLFCCFPLRAQKYSWLLEMEQYKPKAYGVFWRFHCQVELMA